MPVLSISRCRLDDHSFLLQGSDERHLRREDIPRGRELEKARERLPLGGLEPRDAGEFDRELADGRVRRRLGAQAFAAERDPEDFGRVLGEEVDGGGVRRLPRGAVDSVDAVNKHPKMTP